VLYEMVCGVQPFVGANWHGLMWSIMEGKPKPLTEHQIEEPALWSILQRGLAKEREDRFGSMFEFGQALAIWLIDQGVTRDICNTGLKATWLERSPNSSAAMHSYFPSDAPGSSDAQPAVAGPAPAADVTAPAQPGLLAPNQAKAAQQGVLLDSKSRIRRSFGAFGVRKASTMPGNSSKSWIAVGVVGALLSFSAAVAYSWSSQSEDKQALEEDEAPSITVRKPSKDLGIRTRRDLLPGATPLPKTQLLSDELDSFREARELAHSANSTPKKSPTAVKPGPRPVAKKPTADLKDPFDGAK